MRDKWHTWTCNVDCNCRNIVIQQGHFWWFRYLINKVRNPPHPSQMLANQCISDQAGIHRNSEGQVARCMDSLSAIRKISAHRHILSLQQVLKNQQRTLQGADQFTYPTLNRAHPPQQLSTLHQEVRYQTLRKLLGCRAWVYYRNGHPLPFQMPGIRSRTL